MLLTDKKACRKLKSLIIKTCLFRGYCLDMKDIDLVTIVHWYKLLPIATKSSTSDALTVLDSPPMICF